MSDTASLKIAIETSDVKKANDELNKLSKTSDNAEKSTQGVTKSFSALNAVLTVGAVSVVASQFIKLADTMTGVQSKLKLVTSSTNELATAQSELFKIAQTTRQGFAETVDMYSNFSESMTEMGKSQKEILKITETVSKAVAISGGTAQQAAASIQQLGQAFGSGTLAGDELKSISENSKGLFKAIADGIGVPTGALKKMGADGKITSEILANALDKSAKSVDEKFSKVGVTVEQSMTQLKNSLTNAVGEMDKATGASTALSHTITALSGVFSYAATSIHSFNIEINRLQDVRKIKTFEDANTALKQIDDEIKALTTSTNLSDRAKRTLMGEVQIRAKLIQLRAAEAELNRKVNNIAEDELKIQDKKDKAYKNRPAVVAETKAKKGKTDAQKEADKEAERVKGLEEEVTKLKIENNNDVLKNQMDNDAKAYQDAIKKREDELAKFKGIKGAELEINRGFNNTVESLNKQLVDKRNADEIASSTEMYQILNELSGNWYANEIVNISNRAAAFAASGQSDISVLKYVAEATQAIDAKLAIQSIDEMNSALSETNDVLSGFNDFGANLDGIAGKIGNIAKTISDMSKNNARFINQDIANQKKYAKAFLSANGDIEKEKLAQFELDQDSSKLTEEKLNSEIAGYAALAGTMASAFEQGSAGAIAFTALQSALGIASSWTAIAEAWALGFPQNIPAVAAVTSAVMPIISQLGGSGSNGGGSVTGGQKGVDYQYNKNMIDTSYTPITDRLDRQISLLESIDKQGSASALGVISSGVSFQRDIQKWVQEVLSQSVQGALGVNSNQGATQAIVDQFNKSFGRNLYTVRGDNIFADYSMLQSSSDVISALLTSVNTGVAGIFGLLEDYKKIKFESQSTKLIRVVSELNDLQNIIGDWAEGIMGSMDDLKSASKDFKGYFDDITGTMFYETQRLNQAFNEVNKLTGKQSLSSYLQNTIKDIDALQSFFTQDTFTLLMSNNLDDIEAQIDALDRLSEITGKTFEGGAREALDYLESIKLVSEAMATSRKNMESFVDSLRTDQEKAFIMASSAGVTLATNVDGLASLFRKLSNDSNGLTDSDLALLEANKSLLENTDAMQKKQDEYNKTLQDTTQSISVLQSALGTISSTIEKLRSASRTSEQNLQEFYDAMAEAQRLSKTDDYAAYADAVKKAADTSSALFNKDNFTLSRDMEYAQLVAANQFEALGETTLTQVDYLKQIEINTRTQIDVLVEAMNSLGDNINSSLLELLANFKQESSPTVANAIDIAYQKVLGRTAETAGMAYWQKALNTGTVTEGTLGQSVVAGAVASGELTREQAIAQLYVGGLGRPPDQAGLDYWVNSGIPVSELPAILAKSALANGEVYQSFAVGTPNVPYDMIANIHKGEMIVPEPEAEAWRNGSLVGNNNALVYEVQMLRGEVSNLLKINNNYQEKIDRNTKQNLFQGVV